MRSPCGKPAGMALPKRPTKVLTFNALLSTHALLDEVRRRNAERGESTFVQGRFIDEAVEEAAGEILGPTEMQRIKKAANTGSYRQRISKPKRKAFPSRPTQTMSYNALLSTHALLDNLEYRQEKAMATFVRGWFMDAAIEAKVAGAIGVREMLRIKKAANSYSPLP
jgi:hypothetical protein